MGQSKYFLLGSLKAGTTNYKDYTKQSAAPARPAAGVIRTWLDTNGIMNFFAETGATLKAIFGVQADYNDAIAKKHSNALDHTQGSDGSLAAGTADAVTAAQLKPIVGLIQGVPLTGSVMAGFGEATHLNALSGNYNLLGGTANACSGDKNLIAGENNVTTSDNNLMAGGDNATSGDASYNAIMGKSNIVEGSNNLIAGSGHNIVGYNNSVTGANNSITGDNSAVEGANNGSNGYFNHVEGNTSMIIEVDYCHAEGREAFCYNHTQHAKASGKFDGSDIGSAQYTNIIAKAISTTETPVDMTVGATSYVLVQENKMNAFTVRIVASTADILQGASYELKGLIKRNDTEASTALIGSLTKTVIAESVADWDVTATADTTIGALKITVTGQSSTTIRWVAFVEMVEVAF
ncbi:MAG TPA: hypothetical protein PKW50_01765 [Syntrophomonas sp.]|nr:hypothetical protein [Syntrophomonas sp.]